MPGEASDGDRRLELDKGDKQQPSRPRDDIGEGPRQIHAVKNNRQVSL